MSITKQLALFIDVVQQGSFTKAAALHNMDNSALSKKIKLLEAKLGVQLLNRSTRSFALTPAGEEILAQAHILVDTLDQINSIADSYQSQPKGILRITSPVYFGQLYLQPIITQFMQRYPQVKISLILDDKKADIIGDHFDLAFRMGKLADSNLIAKKIADTHFAIVASQGFIEKYGLPQTPDELAQLPAVVYSNSDFSLDLLRISEQPHGEVFKNYRMRGNLKMSDVSALVSAVSDGMGYTMLDLSNLYQSADELGLVPLLTDHVLSNLDRAIYAIYPHRKQTLLVKEFVNAVVEYIGTPPLWERHVDNYGQLYR
ncbi:MULTISPECIES: LysR family transcriptional regulator [Shewanella]|uniref:LysR family transcriptional regulator n=1 Tax=Shewanella TaxID=22 RepID=UPI00048A65CD|nr:MULTISPECIES: LysR family transcriptional regulator [Shewanella]QLE83680.1 LysR family transcriptional regulator [Shewanella sp. Scap07]